MFLSHMADGRPRSNNIYFKIYSMFPPSAETTKLHIFSKFSKKFLAHFLEFYLFLS